MKNISISLGNYFTAFIDAQIQSGRYGSASEVIRAGLRLLEEQDIKCTVLREALLAGELSGEPALFDNEEFLARMREKHNTKDRPKAHPKDHPLAHPQKS